MLWNLFLELTISGVSLYVLVFESRAKYLYMFVPIYLLMAANGVDVLSNRDSDYDEKAWGI